MEPSEKSDMAEHAINTLFGFDRRAFISLEVCVPEPIGCGRPAEGFRDEVSRREYRISGLCQLCQDKIFGGP